jgi:excisionase family DNA binding protein
VESGKLLQVREAAEELGVHQNTLRRWEEAGYIRAVKLPSGVRRFRSEDVGRLRGKMNRNIVDHEGVSIASPEGASAIRTLTALATQKVSLGNLTDDRYGVEFDGSLRLHIDEESFDLLMGMSPVTVNSSSG